MGERTTLPGAAPRSAGLGEYLKRAFLYRWNLLLFPAAAAFAALTPWPDALLALVAAGELAYLAGLVSQTKFRQAVDATAHRQSRQTVAAQSRQSLEEIVGALPADYQHRFAQLRARCLEMRAIAQGARGRAGAGAAPGDDLTAGALDRLLWVFLRLLVSQQALQRFLDRTDVNEIRARLEEARTRLAAAGGDERMARSLQDSVAAQEMRLDNYEKARQNAEFVRVELDRIEAKIQALTEASVNRQDPDFLSSQIDSVADNMRSTEAAITELQQLTGVVDELQEPPAILDAPFGKVAQR